MSVASAYPAQQERRRALICGVDGASSSAVKLAHLNHAERDAVALAATLSGPACGFTLAEPPLIGAAARSHALKQAILQLTHDCDEADMLLLYFSGHAELLRLDSGAEDIFLITHDFSPQEAKRDPTMHLSMGWLFEHVYRTREAGSVVIVLDCCLAGSFRAAGPDPLKIDLRALLGDYRDRRGQPNHPRDNRARVVLAATGYGRPAYERDGHGRMTGMLLSALNGEVAEVCDATGGVTLQRLHAYLERSLPEQHPDLIGNLSRPLVLAWHRRPAPGELISREQRLRALRLDQGYLLENWLSGFVGRAQELAAVRGEVARLLPSGGFVLITGQPGQGKSSLVSQLINEYGPDQVTFHFVPIRPGPDHQISLLRNLLSQLILKHQLDEVDVPGVSRAALRDDLAYALKQIAARGRSALIFIDGLDQLEDELNGDRDLSFLPAQPLPNIVFVLSSRPNDTLPRLQHLPQTVRYALPDLSRGDFEQLLVYHRVPLTAAWLDRFYHAMKGNALYLDLVARGLALSGAQPIEQLLQKISDDPDRLFSLTIERLRLRRPEWRATIKPILGALMVAAEPLSIRALRQLVEGSDDESIRTGIERLGGLVIRDSAGGCALYHSKFRDFLQQDDRRPDKSYIFATDEQEGWHLRLAAWCEQIPGGQAAIWRSPAGVGVDQERRDYARRHYLSHLFHGRHWQQLWKLLDDPEYGLSRLRRDPSAHSYIQDLELGRQALAQSEWTPATVLEQLPRLWRYSLLRCSLLRPAVNCPEVVFEALVLCGRKHEALGLAELIGAAEQKSAALRALGGLLSRLPGNAADGSQALQRSGEVALQIAHPVQRSHALIDTAVALAVAKAPEQVWRWIDAITTDPQRVEGLKLTAVYLARSGDCSYAFVLAQQIADIAIRAQVLASIAEELRQEDPTDLVTAIGRAADECAGPDLPAAVQVEARQASAWVHLVAGRAAAARAAIDAALALVPESGDPAQQTMLWLRLASLLKQAGQADRADQAIGQASAAAREIDDPIVRAERRSAIILHTGDVPAAVVQPLILQTLHEQLVIADPWLQNQTLRQFAEVVFASAHWQLAAPLFQLILPEEQRESVLLSTLVTLALRGRWTVAEQIARMVASDTAYARALVGIVLQCGLPNATLEFAQLDHDLAAVRALQRDRMRDSHLDTLARLLAEIGQWDRALLAARAIGEEERQIAVLGAVAVALAHSQQIDMANAVIGEIMARRKPAETLGRVHALCQIAQMLGRAERREAATNLIMRASELADRLPDRHWQSSAQLHIARALISNGQPKAAAPLLDAIVDTVRLIADGWERSRALTLGAELAAQAGREDLAEQLGNEALAFACALENPLRQASALYGIAQRVAGVSCLSGQASRALQTAALCAPNIYDLGQRAGTLALIAGLQASLGEGGSAELLSQALALLPRLDAPSLAQASQAIALAYMRLGQWDHAIALAQAVAADGWRDRALGQVAAELVGAGEWQRGVALLGEITFAEQRTLARYEVAGAAALRGQVLQAMTLVGDDLEPPEGQAHRRQYLDALMKIAPALGAAQQYDRLLLWVHRHWLHAQSSELLLQLLSLASDLVVRWPDLGSALADGFGWSDAIFG